jgi:acetyl-CoA carboxylase carboxyltransferase component
MKTQGLVFKYPDNVDTDVIIPARYLNTSNAQDQILAFSGATEQCAAYIRTLISFIPDNSSVGIIASECADNLNKMLGELEFSGNALTAISVISDNSIFYEIAHDFVPSVSTVLTTIGGVKCGVVATSYSINEGRISVNAARKITKFINYCDAFSIPVVTLVDSIGLEISKDNEEAFFSSELAKLALAYSSSSCPKVTVIMGHAIGASFVLLGSKSLGADIVYATDDSEICALPADSGVAFAWDKYITLDKTRESLVDEWKETVSSPARAAASGEIDDIISVNELRARICSALLMLCAKGQNSLIGRKVLPL